MFWCGNIYALHDPNELLQLSDDLAYRWGERLFILMDAQQGKPESSRIIPERFRPECYATFITSSLKIRPRFNSWGERLLHTQ